jgi:hypothetical protein
MAKMPRYIEAPPDEVNRAYLAECERVHKASQAWEEQLRRERTMRPAHMLPTDEQMINNRGLSRGNLPPDATRIHDGRQVPIGGFPEVRKPLPPVDPTAHYQPPAAVPWRGQRPEQWRDLTPQEMVRVQSRDVLPTEGTPGLPRMPAFDPTGIPGNNGDTRVRIKTQD